MQAVVLAAGRGTRLRPVTEGRSKAMVPVVGTPLVELALAPLVESGVRDVVMVVGPNDDEIREHFSKRSQLDVSIQWVIQKDRLGMAHALLQAAPTLHGAFILTACDSLVGTRHVRDLLDAARDADSVLSLLDVEPQMVSRSAAVELDGTVVRRIVEKPPLEEAPSHTVSLPHYVFSPLLLPLLAEVSKSSRGEFELQEAIQRHIDAGSRVVGVRAPDRLQVSSPTELLGLNLRKLREGRGLAVDLSPDVQSEALITEPVRIEKGAMVGRGCIIGPEVFLEAGCAVGDQAVVRGSIVLRGARVAARRTVIDSVVVGAASDAVQRKDGG